MLSDALDSLQLLQKSATNLTGGYFPTGYLAHIRCIHSQALGNADIHTVVKAVLSQKLS